MNLQMLDELDERCSYTHTIVEIGPAFYMLDDGVENKKDPETELATRFREADYRERLIEDLHRKFEQNFNTLFGRPGSRIDRLEIYSYTYLSLSSVWKYGYPHLPSLFSLLCTLNHKPKIGKLVVADESARPLSQPLQVRIFHYDTI